MSEERFGGRVVVWMIFEGEKNSNKSLPWFQSLTIVTLQNNSCDNCSRIYIFSSLIFKLRDLKCIGIYTCRFFLFFI